MALHPGLGLHTKVGSICWLLGNQPEVSTLHEEGLGGERSKMELSGHKGKLDHRSRASDWFALSPEG